jgi:hypothetical protein
MRSCNEVNFEGGLGIAEGESELCQNEAVDVMIEVWVLQKFRRTEPKEDGS